MKGCSSGVLLVLCIPVLPISSATPVVLLISSVAICNPDGEVETHISSASNWQLFPSHIWVPQAKEGLETITENKSNGGKLFLSDRVCDLLAQQAVKYAENPSVRLDSVET